MKKYLIRIKLDNRSTKTKALLRQSNESKSPSRVTTTPYKFDFFGMGSCLYQVTILISKMFIIFVEIFRETL